jgi:hypothetical protein
MIQLRSDCLVYETPEGDGIPCAAEELAIQLIGEGLSPADREMLRQATLAVLYYFKHEQERDTITLGEFSEALERVLRGFGLRLPQSAPAKVPPRIADSDLRRVACASGSGCELFFFPLLREELRRRLDEQPEIIRFTGLRGCVKQLAGARRWTRHCQRLSDQIVEFLRQGFSSDGKMAGCALLVR